MNHCDNAWNVTGKTPPDLPKGNPPAPTLAEEVFALKRDRPTEILVEVYAVRGDPSREHTLVFHGTPDEFAFFKSRLDEWAKKRISP